jgi:hypothetical protein
MSTLTSETRERSAKLRAQLAAARTELEAVLEKQRKTMTDFMELLRSARAELTNVLNRGGEKRTIVETIEEHLSAAEIVLATLSEARSDFDDAHTLAMIDSYIREAGDIADWMRQLAQEASKPIPPFDESKLPSPPTDLKAEGFVSIAEARKRLSR